MKILYAARVSRPDLLRPIQGLARHIHSWSKDDDEALHQVMCYIMGTKQWSLTSWIGEDIDEIGPYLFTDSDHAGDRETMRSTSGVYLTVRGHNSSFPIAMRSKRQTVISCSSTESELVAFHEGLKSTGLPVLALLEQVWQLRHSDRCVVGGELLNSRHMSNQR